jgi:hypothetical protein
MPEGARPDSHIAAGAWCFAGREDKFPGWDGDGPGAPFPLPPDPFPDADAILDAARSANAEVLRLCRLFAGDGVSEKFSLTAFGPFLLLAAHMLLERQKRVLDLIALYGGERLRVETVPEGDFSFGDSLDFMLRGVQNPSFNHYVYSRILESAAPAGWEAIENPKAAPAPSFVGPRRSGRDLLRRALLFLLPFPPAKGFGLWEILLLSCAVLLNRREMPDASLDFAAYCSAPPRWVFPAERLIRRCLPTALAEALGKPLPKTPASSRGRIGALRGMSPAYSQDDAYCLRLGVLRAGGCRLFGIQHGANYGNLKSVGGLPFEYSQHAFFTWGWGAGHANPANAVPLPHPALLSVAGRHKEEKAVLILVGAEMSSLSYRLKSRPQSGALVAYRRAKIAFFNALLAGKTKDMELEYRPYFRVAGGLEDGSYVLSRLPEVKLCAGDLTRRMLGCRLLVLDHYGTTLHCALAADVPTLAFWRREDWGMDGQSGETLETLRRAGMLFDDAQSAAARVPDLWDDTERWWKSDAVRAARRLWLERYADIGGLDRPLGRGRNLLAWFKALRTI